MAHSNDVRTGVRSFILQNFLMGERPESLQDSTPLITTGIVSSVAMLELVAFLEDTYSIVLRQDDLTSDRLDSVDLIVGLVEELQSPKEVN
jgi:acyl carrier protein